jgi:cytochrome b involved in lipid metabolism
MGLDGSASMNHDVIVLDVEQTSFRHNAVRLRSAALQSSLTASTTSNSPVTMKTVPASAAAAAAAVGEEAATELARLTRKTTSSPVPTVTFATLGTHNSRDDCWVAVHGRVFDVSSFLSLHPGGAGVILGVVGQDGSDVFEQYHDDDDVLSVLPLVGVIPETVSLPSPPPSSHIPSTPASSAPSIAGANPRLTSSTAGINATIVLD